MEYSVPFRIVLRRLSRLMWMATFLAIFGCRRQQWVGRLTGEILWRLLVAELHCCTLLFRYGLASSISSRMDGDQSFEGRPSATSIDCAMIYGTVSSNCQFWQGISSNRQTPDHHTWSGRSSGHSLYTVLLLRKHHVLAERKPIENLDLLMSLR